MTTPNLYSLMRLITLHLTASRIHDTNANSLYLIVIRFITGTGQ